MKVELVCNSALIKVESIRFYIHLNSPLIVEFDICSTLSLKWSEFKKLWMRVEANINVDDAPFDKLNLLGIGWRPRRTDDILRDCIKTLIAYSIDSEIFTWLLNRPSTQPAESFLLYQRRLEEGAEVFFKRCLGNKLSNLPNGINFEGCIAPAACIVRKPDWNNCNFLTALCQHLMHKDRKLEGWSTLGDLIWLISRPSEPSIDFSDDWNVSDLGFSDRLLEVSSVLDFDIVTRSSSQDFKEFINAISNANQLTFQWQDRVFPRLPTLIRWEEYCYFCREILFTFIFDDGNTFNWTSKCKLCNVNAFSTSTPLQHVNLNGEFDTWSADDTYCVIKPIKSSNWKVVNSYTTDLIEDTGGLFVKNFAPGHISNESGSRDGLFFNFKTKDKIDFSILPGDIPRSFGLLQSKNDTSDSCTFTLIHGKNRLNGTADNDLEIIAEKDIFIKTSDGNIKLVSKSLEAMASSINFKQNLTSEEIISKLTNLSNDVKQAYNFDDLTKVSSLANELYKSLVKNHPTSTDNNEFAELKKNLIKTMYEKRNKLFKNSDKQSTLCQISQFETKFNIKCPEEIATIFNNIKDNKKELLFFDPKANINDCGVFAKKIANFLNPNTDQKPAYIIKLLLDSASAHHHFIYPLNGITTDKKDDVIDITR
jgi:hypothetical protein